MAESLLPEVSRRGFLRTSLFGTVAGGLGAFGVASLSMLWPRVTGGFGAAITLPGDAVSTFDSILEIDGPFEFPAGRLYLVPWDPARPGAMEAYGETQITEIPGRTGGLMALHQKCVHLGCRVPWCDTSKWFECPCHGSRYNRWGEWTGGPAPRGLDRFVTSLDDDGNIIVDTGALVEGPARTAAVLQQDREGPACA